MQYHPHWRSVALMAALAVSLPLAVAAQDASTDRPADEPPLIEGLGWYTSIDVAGSEIESAFTDEEVEQWVAMLDVAGASVEDLEYTYQRIIDPATLPQLGGLATVRIADATEDEVLAAVLADVSAQAVTLGAEPTAPEPLTLGGKEVVKVDLPVELGPDDAFVYVRGDTAWLFIMQESLAELGLQELP
ncbi:MAG: hypothetical protein AB1Z67_11230 [Candidatus Limnocylindrales bacterium]